ncbi:hypothetical protein [Roseovarius sp. TE539]|uniref:hypothetical protein n=1 Tax=Roseovarius sp. TE539 TaxID=2249812 RepID=UPI0011BF67C8|nr:hypothetical protein [Roseovarius sp. TE539]
MAHILSLILLMGVALPFVGPGAGSLQGNQGDVIAMDVRDCGEHFMSGNSISVCPGAMVHCVTFTNVDHSLREPQFFVVHVYHRSSPVDAESLTPEASSPPPRA